MEVHDMKWKLRNANEMIRAVSQEHVQSKSAKMWR